MFKNSKVKFVPAEFGYNVRIRKRFGHRGRGDSRSVLGVVKGLRAMNRKWCFPCSPRNSSNGTSWRYIIVIALPMCGINIIYVINFDLVISN